MIKQDGIKKWHDLCDDCTEPTPCCGYGPCNMFCCHCDTGCRRGVPCTSCPKGNGTKCSLGANVFG
uniref:Uncharacterized protein n=1 Tax=Romanomermis culicivorax TaxID=13658 RepID=A0A915JA49_ROMCU